MNSSFSPCNIKEILISNWKRSFSISQTRMHSSRMRIDRCSGRLGGSAREGVWGVSAQGVVCAQRGCTPPPGGQTPVKTLPFRKCAHLPPVDRQTPVTSNACQHCVVLPPSCLSGFSGSGDKLDSCILIR